MEFGEEEKNRTQACKDDGHHDERSAATTLINALVLFFIIKKHVWLYLWRESLDENKLLYEHEYLCA